MNIQFRIYQKEDFQSVIDLILAIQQKEFGVGISAEDQPDLKNIPNFYQSGHGNFWVAVYNEKIIGTIALLDIGNQQVALRKMFVAKSHRGSKNGVANQLLTQCHEWAKKRKVTDVYLGTISIYHAAMRFYEKNGYLKVMKNELPKSFPLIAVDDVFYHKQFNIQ